MTATVKRHVRSGSAELCVEDTATGGPALRADEFNLAVQSFLDRLR